MLWTIPDIEPIARQVAERIRKHPDLVGDEWFVNEIGKAMAHGFALGRSHQVRVEHPEIKTWRHAARSTTVVRWPYNP